MSMRSSSSMCRRRPTARRSTGLVRARPGGPARRRPLGGPTSSCRRRRRRRGRGRTRRGTRRGRGRVASRRSERSSSTLAGQRDGIASRRLRRTISVAFCVELHVAAGGQERELQLHGPLDVSAGAAEQRPVAAVEAELLAVGADEVEHGAERLARCLAQAAAELLEEQRRALGRAQHEHGVDGGDVDALVEQVDGEHDPHARRRPDPAGRPRARPAGCRPRRRPRRCRGG